ncbi:MAG TPA: alpha/beta hydrolase [Nitrospiraceae bacterium]|nr:alpha/beta hydrolase [Nitrospiraceae bacterium]
MKHLGKTPPFRGPQGETLPGSVAEIRYLRLGGVDQWVMIRGESVANPALILLHGGPGFPEMRLFRHFNAAIEKSFTVVYWEQRGTDKSFDRKIPSSSLTVEQLIADLDELVEAVRKRLGKDKVVIYGHSWGSALGVLYVARFPDKVAAYVGTGQLGDWPASELSSYAFVLAEAERRNNRKALKELRAIGAPPHTFREMMVQRKWLVRFVGIARGMSLWKFFRITLCGPESSIFDLPNILRGSLSTPNAMWAEVSALNLVKAVPVLQVPVFFFIGRHDHVVASETSVAYFDMLTAPSKSLVWFEDSAHEPPVEEPAKFNAAMAELVRPAVR